MSMILDNKNKGLLFVSKGLPANTKFFEAVVPQERDGLVRIDLNFFYNYYQYIDENTTRYIVLANTDVKIDIIPEWLMAHLTK